MTSLAVPTLELSLGNGVEHSIVTRFSMRGLALLVIAAATMAGANAWLWWKEPLPDPESSYQPPPRCEPPRCPKEAIYQVAMKYMLMPFAADSSLPSSALYIDIEGRNPTVAFLARLREDGLQVRPVGESEWAGLYGWRDATTGAPVVVFGVTAAGVRGDAVIVNAWSRAGAIAKDYVLTLEEQANEWRVVCYQVGFFRARGCDAP